MRSGEFAPKGGDVLYMGVDVGTSSTKGVLIDRCGEIVADAVVGHGVSTPAPGRVEQDAETVWWHDLTVVSRRLLNVATARVGAVAVSGIGPCVLPVDIRGNALMPAILYGIDARSSNECEELAGLYARIGIDARFDTQSVLPKMRWIERNQPRLWARTAAILGCGGYLTSRLCGSAVVDAYEAGSYQPVYDARKRSWSGALPPELRRYRLLLPRVASGCSMVGRVCATASMQTGLAPGTPVIAPTIDAAAEATGAGVRGVGDLMLMYGSTGFFIALQNSPVTNHLGIWRSSWLDGELYTAASGINALGLFFAWFINRFAIEGIEEFMRLSHASVPGANGVVMLPFIEGERTPWFDPRLSGGMLGVRGETTRADLCRAATESVAFAIGDALDALDVDAHTVHGYAVGGATANDLLLQTVSDITGIGQCVPADPIGASLGDALRAAVGDGCFASLDAAAATITRGHMVNPNFSNQQVLRRNRELYQQLINQTQHISHGLTQ